MPFPGTHLKYRHVYGKAANLEQCYESIPISCGSHNGQLITCNPHQIAVALECSGGGAFAIMPSTKVERLAGVNLPKINGHSSPVLNVQWNPFNDTVLASSSMDCTVKLWKFPLGYHSILNSPISVLGCPGRNVGHTRAVTQLEWHPTCESLIATSGIDKKLFLWSTDCEEPVLDMEDLLEGQVVSLSWSCLGNQLAFTTKERCLHVVDPRSKTVVMKTACHQGVRSSNVLFITSDLVVTAGFGRQGDRECMLWDLRSNLSSPVQVVDLDHSCGIIYPFFDPDCSILYLAGKGDSSIRYYELSNGSLHFLNQYTSNHCQRGMGMMPKLGLNQFVCEIARFYKLNATQNSVDPISMIAPRRANFKSDLYASTKAPLPSVTCNDWLAGIDKEPIKLNLANGKVINPQNNTPKSLIPTDVNDIPIKLPESPSNQWLDATNQVEAQYFTLSTHPQNRYDGRNIPGRYSLMNLTNIDYDNDICKTTRKSALPLRFNNKTDSASCMEITNSSEEFLSLNSNDITFNSVSSPSSQDDFPQNKPSESDHHSLYRDPAVKNNSLVTTPSLLNNRRKFKTLLANFETCSQLNIPPQNIEEPSSRSGLNRQNNVRDLRLTDVNPNGIQSDVNDSVNNYGRRSRSSLAEGETCDSNNHKKLRKTDLSIVGSVHLYDKSNPNSTKGVSSPRNIIRNSFKSKSSDSLNTDSRYDDFISIKSEFSSPLPTDVNELRQCLINSLKEIDILKRQLSQREARIEELEKDVQTLTKQAAKFDESSC